MQAEKRDFRSGTNYDILNTADVYIHRIGRTGRAEHRGDVFTLIRAEDAQVVKAIDRVLGSKTERRTLSDFNHGDSKEKTKTQQKKSTAARQAKSGLSRHKPADRKNQCGMSR